ncbi:MAG TPA: pseudouridine synthase [Candidatus Saccharimonadia bacterium]|nr:pseudouridine synthase [Candidatus Saccharimonadia bacterium]
MLAAMRKRPDDRRDRTRGAPTRAATPVHGVARTLSKLGYCSRTAAEALVREGRVSIAGRVVADPTEPVLAGAPISVDGRAVEAAERVYLMLNKPRGLVTTVRDEGGRDTVYRCLEGSDLPWLAPVGRLDRASEGLLLFSNDPAWAARVTDPASRIEKTYHVQVDRLPDEALLRALVDGVEHAGEPLAAVRVSELRRGERNAWLEIVLDEGRNREIRRLLGAFDVGVLRLVRVAIGGLVLGDLAKGRWRRLDAGEIASLASAGKPPE